MLYLKTPSKLVLCHFEILSHCHTFGPLIYGMTHMYVYLVGPLFFLLPRQAHLPGASQQGGKPIGRADARQFIIFFFLLRLFGERARESPCGRDPCFCSMRDVLKTCLDFPPQWSAALLSCQVADCCAGMQWWTTCTRQSSRKESCVYNLSLQIILRKRKWINLQNVTKHIDHCTRTYMYIPYSE